MPPDQFYEAKPKRPKDMRYGDGRGGRDMDLNRGYLDRDRQRHYQRQSYSPAANAYRQEQEDTWSRSYQRDEVPRRHDQRSPSPDARSHQRPYESNTQHIAQPYNDGTHSKRRQSRSYGAPARRLGQIEQYDRPEYPSPNRPDPKYDPFGSGSNGRRYSNDEVRGSRENDVSRPQDVYKFGDQRQDEQPEHGDPTPPRGQKRKAAALDEAPETPQKQTEKYLAFETLLDTDSYCVFAKAEESTVHKLLGLINTRELSKGQLRILCLMVATQLKHLTRLQEMKNGGRGHAEQMLQECTPGTILRSCDVFDQKRNGVYPVMHDKVVVAQSQTMHGSKMVVCPIGTSGWEGLKDAKTMWLENPGTIAVATQKSPVVKPEVLELASLGIPIIPVEYSHKSKSMKDWAIIDIADRTTLDPLWCVRVQGRVCTAKDIKRLGDMLDKQHEREMAQRASLSDSAGEEDDMIRAMQAQVAEVFSAPPGSPSEASVDSGFGSSNSEAGDFISMDTSGRSSDTTSGAERGDPAARATNKREGASFAAGEQTNTMSTNSPVPSRSSLSSDTRPVMPMTTVSRELGDFAAAVDLRTYGTSSPNATPLPSPDPPASNKVLRATNTARTKRQQNHRKSAA